MSRFFYSVIVPKGETRLAGTKIVSGRLITGNALEAVRAVEKMHPRAISLHVHKEKRRAVSSI